MRKLILLVEDNAQILRGNERMLKRRGFDTVTAMTLRETKDCMSTVSPDVIVLDIMLPDGNGLDFMRELREKSNIPILLLTGLTTPEDIVRGLDDGGDDYLTKPYDFSVLLAHIEALLRRSSHIPKHLTKGTLTMDIRANRAFLSGIDMLLTPKEFAVLLLLAENEGRIITTNYIYESVWKQDDDSNTSVVVKNVMSRLRKKLGKEILIENDRETDGYILTQIRV